MPASEICPRRSRQWTSSPTRFGSVTSQMRSFLDQAGELWAQGKLVGKVGSAFTSTATQHGGQESTILTFIPTLMHFGMMVVGLPYSFEGQMDLNEILGGSPYGAATISGSDGSRSLRPSSLRRRGSKDDMSPRSRRSSPVMRAPRPCRNDEPRDHHYNSQFSPSDPAPPYGSAAVRRRGAGVGAGNMARRRDEIAALRLGLNLGLSVIDTAEMYADGEAEILVGEADQGAPR